MKTTTCGEKTHASQVPELKWLEWVPDGRAIYVTGILTGTTYLTVTDNATQETCTLPIKVVDNYEKYGVATQLLV